MNIKSQNNGYRTNRILGTSLQTFPERQKTIKRSSLPPPRPHSSLSQSICRDAKQTRHVIRRSDISGGSQAEEDGSNTLRWLAAAQRCNYAPPPSPTPTAYSFWRSALSGKSFNRADCKYFSNLPNLICFSKWSALMFKQSIGTTKPNFLAWVSELGRYNWTLTAGSVSGGGGGWG